jgi:hypothetical protein
MDMTHSYEMTNLKVNFYKHTIEAGTVYYHFKVVSTDG